MVVQRESQLMDFPVGFPVSAGVPSRWCAGGGCCSPVFLLLTTVLGVCVVRVPVLLPSAPISSGCRWYRAKRRCRTNVAAMSIPVVSFGCCPCASSAHGFSRRLAGAARVPSALADLVRCSCSRSCSSTIHKKLELPGSCYFHWASFCWSGTI